MSSTAQDLSSKDQPLQEDALEEIFNLDPAVLKQLLQIDKAIQRLPPELREIIYKEYVAIKQRERAALGWKKVNEEILKYPFCLFMQQIVPTKIPCDYVLSSFDKPFKCHCYSCLFSGEKKRLCLHEVLVTAEMEILSQPDENIEILSQMDMKSKIEMVLQLEMEMEKYDIANGKIPLIEKIQDYQTILRKFYK